MTDIEQLVEQTEKKDNQPIERVRLLLGDAVQLRDELEAADAAAAVAVRQDKLENREPQAPALAARAAEIEEQIVAAQTEFVFRSIGRRAWRDLVAAHPPTSEQRRVDARAEINGKTFPVAAIAECCIEPKMSASVVARLEGALSDGQWERLWAGCLAANGGGADIPKSVAAGSILRASGLFGGTAAIEESLDPSSSAES